MISVPQCSGEVPFPLEHSVSEFIIHGDEMGDGLAPVDQDPSAAWAGDREPTITVDRESMEKTSHETLYTSSKG